MTVLRDANGVVHFIPNGTINSVSNETHGWSRAVCDITVNRRENVESIMHALRQVAYELKAAPEFASLMIDDPSLHDALNSLWARITNGRNDIDHDLEHMRQRFSSETTSVAKLADIDLVRLLTLCHRGQPTVVRYRSPWRHDEDKEYGGLFDRLHFSDGMLYALFKESGGRELILNVSFIKEIREVSELPPVAKGDGVEPPSKPYWLEGFGIWSGSKPETIEITISPPASRFYAAQVWHVDQEDTWVGERLVRRFPGIASPELTRRVLSLGRFVVSVRPSFILEQMREDVDHLSSLCVSEACAIK
jgi:small-conductance mechanosensitive channel